MNMNEKRSVLQDALGAFAPKLVELTDEVLFGDVWAREPLGHRERSLITVAALVALNRPEQLRIHLGLAIRNGLTQEELVEALTHLAFYVGWPLAINALLTAQELFTPAEGEA
jgi:4-carboxymuconolactone decarboxylase